MRKAKVESKIHYNHVYRLRQRAIYFAVFCFLVFIYLDTVRFSSSLLKEIFFLRLVTQLLPILVILLTSIVQYKKKIHLKTYHWIASISIFLIGVGHAQILSVVIENNLYFPKVGMAIILYYAGILLALPLSYAITTSLAIIIYATYAYLSTGLATDEVITTSVFYAIFAACCVFMNTVTTQILKSNVKLVKQINSQAQTDSVTHLKNRRAFLDHAEQIIKQSYRTQESFVVMIVDLDNFKHVNDLLGHQQGDKVLIEIAQILREHSRRPLDLASRFGGDEFVLLLYDTDKANAEAVCIQIINEVEQLAKQLADKNTEIDLGISIGAVFNDINQTHDIYSLIKIADKALYQVKNSGKNSYSITKMANFISTGTDSDFMPIVKQ